MFLDEEINLSKLGTIAPVFVKQFIFVSSRHLLTELFVVDINARCNTLNLCG